MFVKFTSKYIAINYMSKNRIKYLLIIILVIFAGLLSRKISIIPLFVGDILWATMMYFMVRFIWFTKHPKTIAIISLAICFLVEISQLYQATWINEIRQTLPGKLILGQGFLWTDLIAYSVGILLAFFLEKLILDRYKK